jgi:LysM repeat protein
VTWWRKGGDYGQPEVKTIPNVPPFKGELNRIRSGNYGVLLFTYYRLQDIGLYQVVSGLEPGATIEFSAHAHGWSCGDKDAKLGYTCGDEWNQRFQVGIEPNGIADPFSNSITWSTARPSPDYFSLIGPVGAQVGESGTVVVFLRSKTRWKVEHQDAYWDDASLVVTSPGTPPTATPLPPPPTPTYGPTPTPRATPTPRPDGATVHVVESGDTIFGIALIYGVDADQIRKLNAGSIGANDMIHPGQELVITLPSGQPTATPLPPPPTPEPTPAEGNPAAPEAEAAPETGAEVAEAEPTGGASICVLAYHDRNGNTFRDDTQTEELLPNVEFTLADASGVVNRYASDGVHEPHCFTALVPGAYRVIQNSPPGYATSGPAEWTVAVAEGTSLDIQFGNVRSGDAPLPEEVTEPTPENGEEDNSNTSSTARRVFATVAKISGIMVLILASGVAVLFVLNRRRM